MFFSADCRFTSLLLYFLRPYVTAPFCLHPYVEFRAQVHSLPMEIPATTEHKPKLRKQQTTQVSLDVVVIRFHLSEIALRFLWKDE